MVITKNQLHTENVTLSQEKVRLSQEKGQLMQDNAKLRQENTQLSLENRLKAKELLDYKKQADTYENERRRSQEVNTQLKSSNQVYMYKKNTS